ncbi:hypothetical protein [Paraburkholderia humisilvae]
MRLCVEQRMGWVILIHDSHLLNGINWHIGDIGVLA